MRKYVLEQLQLNISFTFRNQNMNPSSQIRKKELQQNNVLVDGRSEPYLSYMSPFVDQGELKLLLKAANSAL